MGETNCSTKYDFTVLGNVHKKECQGMVFHACTLYFYYLPEFMISKDHFSCQITHIILYSNYLKLNDVLFVRNWIITVIYHDETEVLITDC